VLALRLCRWCVPAAPLNACLVCMNLCFVESNPSLPSIDVSSRRSDLEAVDIGGRARDESLFTCPQAYAAARMAESVLLALDGTDNIYECTYTESSIVDGLSYFASKVKLGTNGVEEFLPLGELSPYEQKALEELKPMLAGNIAKGIEFATAVKA
jgi:malate dehydrogenase